MILSTGPQSLVNLRTSSTYCVLSTCLSLLCILIYVLCIFKYRTSMPYRLLRCIHSLNGHWDFSMFPWSVQLGRLLLMGLWESWRRGETTGQGWTRKLASQPGNEAGANKAWRWATLLKLVTRWIRHTKAGNETGEQGWEVRSEQILLQLVTRWTRQKPDTGETELDSTRLGRWTLLPRMATLAGLKQPRLLLYGWEFKQQKWIVEYFRLQAHRAIAL